MSGLKARKFLSEYLNIEVIENDWLYNALC